MSWNTVLFDSTGKIKDARVGGGLFTYPATHYVAPFATVGASSDEDPQNPAAFSAAMNPDTPCTLMCAIQNANATILAGIYVRISPGDYVSLATSDQGSFQPRFEVQGSGFSAANPLVFFAANPGAYHYATPASLSNLVQTFGLTGRDALGNTRTVVGCDGFFGTVGKSHVIFDGFALDYGDHLNPTITPADEEGAIGLLGSSSYCEIRRCYVQCADYNTNTGENRSWFFINNADHCRIVDCRFEGNGTSQNHNSSAIQTRWSDACIIEHNYFDGINAIWQKGANWGLFYNESFDEQAGVVQLMFHDAKIRPLTGQTITDATTGATATCLFDANRYSVGDAGGKWPTLDLIRVATTTNLSATASGSGVGKTLTNNSTQVALSIDGVSLSTNDRVVVKDQTTAADNGVYTVTTVGDGSTNWVLTRATDLDQNSEIVFNPILLNFSVYVEEGSTNADTSWRIDAHVVGEDIVDHTIDTDDIVFFSDNTPEGWIPVYNVSGTFGLNNDLEISGTQVARVGFNGDVLASGTYNRSRDCIVRYNYIINSVIYSMMDGDQENVTYYGNFCHAANGLTWKENSRNENDWNKYGYEYHVYNNTFIQNGAGGYVIGGDAGVNQFKSPSRFHSNILINNGGAGFIGNEDVWPAGGEVGDFDIWNRNIYYNISGSDDFVLGYDVGGPTYTSFADWQTNYCAPFGNQPGEPGIAFEATSEDTDPQFVSANYATPESGDWRLAAGSQDARTIGLSAVNGGVCGCYVTGNEEIGLQANPTYGPTQVLWATDATIAAPFNFDSIRNGTYASGYGYPTGDTVTDSQIISEYPTALVHTNHFEGGQMTIGGDITTTADTIWPALEAADALFLRFLIKYGTQNGSAEWAGSWANGGSGGHEYKWPDIGWETDGNRIIIGHAAIGDTSTGKIFARINGDTPLGETQHDIATGLVSNTLYYVEIEINGNGALRSWVAEYDGTNAEYSQGTPTFEDTNAHSWAPDFGTVASGRRINLGFLNHNCVPAQDRYVQLAVNGSFIGPGILSSEN